jgi:hypothetical protein
MSDGFDGGALFDALARHRVRYVVIGGFAGVVHRVLRATEVLEICPDADPENLERLAAMLAELDARQVGADEFADGELAYDPTRPEHLRAGGNFRVTTDVGALDVMQWVPGIDDEHAFARLSRDAVVAEFRGAEVRVASLGAVREMKRAAGREQDLEDLRRLDLGHRDPRQT